MSVRLFILMSVAIILATGMPAHAIIMDGGFEGPEPLQNFETVGSVVVRGEDCGCPAAKGEKTMFLRTDAVVGNAPLEDVFDFIGVSEADLLAAAGRPETNDLTRGSAAKRTLEVPAGSSVRFLWNFLTNEDPLKSFFNDSAFIVVRRLSGDNSCSELLLVDTFFNFFQVSTTTTFDFETGYFPFDFTFTEAGTYELVVAIFDEGDLLSSSALCFDELEFIPQIPLPMSFLLLGFGVAGLIGARRHKA